MKVLFTECWVGWYVGEGSYEGGCCPDLLVTGVPEFEDTSDLFDMYLYLLCRCNDHDKKEFETKIIKRCSRTDKPIEITSKDMLEDCNESFVKVMYNDLVEWYCDDSEDDD